MKIKFKDVFRSISVAPSSGTNPRATTIGGVKADVTGQLVKAGADLFKGLRTVAVDKLRQTAPAQAVEREATKQKIKEVLAKPVVWVALAVVGYLLAKGVMAASRKA